MSKKYCIKILFLLIAEFWGAPLNVTPGVREPGRPSHHGSKNVPTQQLCYGKDREGAAPTVGRAGQGGPRRPHAQDGGRKGGSCSLAGPCSKTRAGEPKQPSSLGLLGSWTFCNMGGDLQLFFRDIHRKGGLGGHMDGGRWLTAPFSSSAAKGPP